MTESDKWFGAKVRQRRTSRGMSCEDLGDLAGVGRMTVGHIESGYQKSYLWQAIRLAKILNINLMKVPLGAGDTGAEPLEKMNSTKSCPDCGGQGIIKYSPKDKTKWDFCYNCEGTGQVESGSKPG